MARPRTSLGVFVASAACAALALYECAFSPLRLPPVASADVDHRILPPDTTAALSAWLDARISGWRLVVITPPPAVVVALHYPSGETTRLSVHRSPPSPPGWNGVVWLQRLSGVRLVVSQLRRVSEDDFKQLAQLIGL